MMPDSTVSRGATAVVSGPLLAPRCVCGRGLVAWGDGPALSWCYSYEDLMASRHRQLTRHDVYGAQGTLLGHGDCQAPALESDEEEL